MATRNKDYGNVNSPNSQVINQPTILVASPSEPLPPTIPTELNIKPPKGVIHKYAFNPLARDAQNYSVVEDLAQSLSVISTLDVLKNFLTNKKAFLSVIG